MRLAIVLGALALVGCASHSGVTPMGGGTYLLSKQAATGFAGAASLKAELLREADQHCAAKGQDFEVISAAENAGPYVFGHYPKAEVQFKCVGKR
jgi:hypothetical protein